MVSETQIFKVLWMAFQASATHGLSQYLFKMVQSAEAETRGVSVCGFKNSAGYTTRIG